MKENIYYNKKGFYNKFGIGDFNNDGIEEFMSLRSFESLYTKFMIWTYNNGKILNVANWKLKGSQAMVPIHEFYYNKKTKCFWFYSTVGFEDGLYCYKFNGKKFHLLAKYFINEFDRQTKLDKFDKLHNDAIKNNSIYICNTSSRYKLACELSSKFSFDKDLKIISPSKKRPAST